MNILMISTSDIRGGAAIAAFRLMNALNANGVSAHMLVKEKLSGSSNVVQTGNRQKNRLNFLAERARIFLHNRLSRKNLFTVSIADRGITITDHPLFRQADVIHLHWINQGMLSLDEIDHILSSGKKVVWTLHDMWSFTGICHHAWGCDHYENGCGRCPFLGSGSPKDLSAQLFKKKQLIYSSAGIRFVCVSRWLADKAVQSALTSGHTIDVIPNIIDTALFSPGENNRHQHQRCKTIVMGAARLDHPIKGFDYLKRALQILVDEKRIKPDSVKLLLFGGVKHPASFFQEIPVTYEYAGQIVDEKEIADLYRRADAVVVPSLYETFGQTLTEGMGCGCPAISFDNSGQTDIITHRQNGYLARYKDAHDLAEGIYWTLFEANNDMLPQNAREKVVTHYSEEKIAEKYIQVYSRQ